MSDAPDRIRALYQAGRFAEAVDYTRSLCRDVDARRGEEWSAVVNAAMNLSDFTTARLAALRWRMEDPDGFQPLVLAAGVCAAARDEEFAKNSIELLVRRFAGRPEAWFAAGVIRAHSRTTPRAPRCAGRGFRTT